MAPIEPSADAHHLPAVDSHAHVFGADYPYAPDRLYEPHPTQAGTAAQFAAVLDAHGFTHGLLVQAQPYGRDNSLHARRHRAGGGRFKGIALVTPTSATRELDRHRRCRRRRHPHEPHDLGLARVHEPGADRPVRARSSEMGWFLQVHCEKDDFVAAAPSCRGARACGS